MVTRSRANVDAFPSFALVTWWKGSWGYEASPQEDWMLSWSTIAYGAALSGIGAGALVGLVIRPREGTIIGTAMAAAFTGPLAWNAILRATSGSSFFHDAPIAFFPVSWQDVGSGVFTLAAAAVLLGVGSMAHHLGRELLLVACLAAASALVVDVYLY